MYVLFAETWQSA